jgi:hypothetical protein
MPSPTLVLADYPIGFSSGFGETLYNLFSGFQTSSLWSAHPVHNNPAKQLGKTVALPSPSRPKWLPYQLSLAFYPALKSLQLMASRRTAQQLSGFIRANSIKNLLVIPVSPWLLAAARRIYRQQKDLNLILFVMDDWQGHHESYDLPYSNRRRRLLTEVIRRADKLFAVSCEMAAHYEQSFGGTWQVAHNGIDKGMISTNGKCVLRPRRILLAGDINVFRFDAVFAFAQALQRYSERTIVPLELTVLGDVAAEYAKPLSNLGIVRILGRRSHSECLEAMRNTDLLYLPLAFSRKATRISLYSLPTKLPEYLATGKTILIHAPRESAAFRIAERYDLNPRLSTVNDDELDVFVKQWALGKLNHLRNEDGVRRALSTEFDLGTLAANFQSAFV